MTKSLLKTTNQHTVLTVYVEGPRRDPVSFLGEYDTLIHTNHFISLACVRMLVKKPSPATFLNSGQVALVAELCAELKPDLVVFSIPIGARIQRNLEKALCVSLLDRTELLLQIFEKRAISASGKLQVELARLTYMSTKLVRGWTHLERQRGGIGLRSGPGETQIEVDRRILRERMHKLKKQLQGLQNTQALNRKKRLGSHTPIVCLVGYTNAGKSTLFNRLTNNESLVMDQLFATLDPLSRKSWLVDRSVVFTDTVGFMRDLPESLITAFRATLDEIVYADLLLHVVDCSDPEWADKIRVVEETLSILSCDHIPTLLVCNKADLVGQAAFLDGVPVSSISGEGIGELSDSILHALPSRS